MTHDGNHIAVTVTPQPVTTWEVAYYMCATTIPNGLYLLPVALHYEHVFQQPMDVNKMAFFNNPDQAYAILVVPPIATTSVASVVVQETSV